MKALFEPEKIERELRMLERERSLTETRTVLFNLVIFNESDAEANLEEDLLGPLLGRRAVRIIRISLGQRGETSVSVSARCAPDRENKGVCFQEILIENGLDNAGIAPGSWSAFLIRDLPVYILWSIAIPDKDPGSPLCFAREQGDKFLIDGEYFLSHGGLVPEEYIRRIKENFLYQGVQLSDFAWERIRPLRVFTAQIFDQPALMALLPKVTRLQVQSSSELSGMYYSKWVSSVLGEEGKRIQMVLHSGTGFQAEFQFRDSPEILSLWLDPSGVGKAFYGDTEVIVKPLKIPQDGEILLEQVDIPVADPLYRRIVEEFP